jgi:hypothetical protein
MALECEQSKSVTRSVGLLRVLRFTKMLSFRIVMNKEQTRKEDMVT